MASAAVTKESWSPSPFWLALSHLKCPYMFPGTATKPNIPAELQQRRRGHHLHPRLLLGPLASCPRALGSHPGSCRALGSHPGALGFCSGGTGILSWLMWGTGIPIAMSPCVSLCPHGVLTVALNAPSPCPHGVPAVAVRALSPCPMCAPCPCRSSHAWGSATRSTRGGRGARC